MDWFHQIDTHNASSLNFIDFYRLLQALYEAREANAAFCAKLLLSSCASHSFRTRANCRVGLAWLIKRLLGRLACTRKNGESDRISFNFSFQETSLERVVHVSRVLTDQTFRREFSRKAGHVKTQAMKIAD